MFIEVVSASIIVVLILFWSEGELKYFTQPCFLMVKQQMSEKHQQKSVQTKIEAI